MLVTYVQKFIAAVEEKGRPVIREIATRAMFQFEDKKLMSPGIRQAAINELNTFFDSVANQSVLAPEDIATSVDAKVMAHELRNLATLVEEGSRVVGLAMFNDVQNNNRKLIVQITNPS